MPSNKLLVSWLLVIRKNRLTNQSPITIHPNGFTLIELMVVISIIAIIAVIGMALFGNAQKGARDAKRISEIHEIQKALEQYYTVNRSYPGSFSSSNISNTTYFPNGTVPTDPSGGNYSYQQNPTCPGNVQGYKLCAQMESIGKGNANGIPANACSLWSAGGTYYCVTNLN